MWTDRPPTSILLGTAHARNFVNSLHGPIKSEIHAQGPPGDQSDTTAPANENLFRTSETRRTNRTAADDSGFRAYQSLNDLVWRVTPFCFQGLI